MNIATYLVQSGLPSLEEGARCPLHGVPCRSIAGDQGGALTHEDIQQLQTSSAVNLPLNAASCKAPDSAWYKLLSEWAFLNVMREVPKTSHAVCPLSVCSERAFVCTGHPNAYGVYAVKCPSHGINYVRYEKLVLAPSEMVFELNAIKAHIA